MKNLKMLGSAAVAAMALMAFTSGTASATTLEEGTVNVHPTVLDLSLVGSAIIETTGGTLLETCTGSAMSGNPSTGSATETVREAVSVTLSNCTAHTTVDQGGELEIHHIAGTSNGTVTAATFEMTQVWSGVSCIWGFSSTDTMRHLGTLIGDDHTPKLEIHTSLVERTGDKFICPNDLVLTATYHVTTPTGLTVTAG